MAMVQALIIIDGKSGCLTKPRVSMVVPRENELFNITIIVCIRIILKDQRLLSEPNSNFSSCKRITWAWSAALI